MQYALLPEEHAVLATVVIPADVPPTYIWMSGKLKLKKLFSTFFIIIFTQHDATVPLVEDAAVVVAAVGIVLP